MKKAKFIRILYTIIFIQCFNLGLNVEYLTGTGLTYADEYQSQKEYRPLIYFSSFDSPDKDEKLRQKIDVGITFMLQYGENNVNNKRILIIKKEENEPLNSYNSVRQLFEFIVQNSKQGRLENNSYNYISYTLFYTDQPLIISCGIISSWFQDFLIYFMQFSKTNVRGIVLYTDDSLQKTAPQDGYLEGGHTILELYFPELKKWVVFDLDMGIIPTSDSIPLSMFEVSQLKSSEVDFYPAGRDKYGKGLKNKVSVDEFYKRAKDCFGFYGKETYFLFLMPQKFVSVFKQNFLSAYKNEAVIITDPELFSQKFY